MKKYGSEPSSLGVNTCSQFGNLFVWYLKAICLVVDWLTRTIVGTIA